MTLFAPAKINLTLEVLARRPQGYHGMRSVMVPVGLYDSIAIGPQLARLSEGGPASDDLVMRALAAADCEPVSVHLEKRIPIGGGLGGGSSDAAAILRAAMEGSLPRTTRAQRDWLATARALGSDVPFFLVGTAALVEGTGERVTALGALPPWWCVVLRPAVAVPTGDAYRLIDDERTRVPSAQRPRSESVSLAMVDALQRGEFAAVSEALGNDFHDVVLRAYPAVGRAAEALERAGAKRTLLCGSGSCVFALFEFETEARSVAQRVDPADAPETFVAPFVADERWR
jgi:4-diphosphocytidyl-2-C-methyl-D-erythritol kinase